MQAQRQRYLKALENSAKRLWSPQLSARIGFGDPARLRTREISGLMTGGLFDQRYWRRVRFDRPGPDMAEGALLLIGKDPAEAIRAIGEHPDYWTMDCATFVQVVQLSALLETLGPVEFNRYMSEQRQRTQGMIILQQHHSTGVQVRYGYSTDEHGQVQRYPAGPAVAGKMPTMEQLADQVPLGSEVVFHNPNAPHDDAFLYENAIKIGRDKYLAYPVGDPIVTGKQIRAQMARMPFRDKSGQSTSRDPKNIRINSIAVFDLLQK
jgi:hypothetical protein